MGRRGVRGGVKVERGWTGASMTGEREGGSEEEGQQGQGGARRGGSSRRQKVLVFFLYK